MGKISVLKIVARAFEAGDFLNIFLRFLGFWGSFSYKKFFLWKKRVDSLKLNKAEPNVRIFSMLLNTLIDSLFDSRWNVFIRRINCSTSILTSAILLVLLTLAGAIWVVPRLPGGTIKYRLQVVHSSNKFKPLYAICCYFWQHSESLWSKGGTKVNLMYHRPDNSQYCGVCILIMLHFLTPNLLAFLSRLHCSQLSLLGFGIEKTFRWDYANCFNMLYVNKRSQVMCHCP